MTKPERKLLGTDEYAGWQKERFPTGTEGVHLLELQ